MNAPIRIAVIVNGGCVSEIVTDSPSLVDVIVIDMDEATADNMDHAEFTERHTFADGSTVGTLTQQSLLHAAW